jgi:hypothetical protein
MLSYSVLLDFLSIEEQSALQEYAETSAYESGRQDTGYLKAAIPKDIFKELKVRSLAALGADQRTKHDCYIIRYPKGSRIPPHQDDAPFGSEHHRLNAIIQASEIGGVFGVEARTIDLLPRDGVLFRPDAMKHRITTVYGNTERLVWSVGILKG